MTSSSGHGYPRQERFSVAPSVAHSIALSDSLSPSKSGDKLSDQLAGPFGAKPLINTSAATISVPKYSKDNLQRIFKAVLEVQAPIPVLALASAPVPALVVSEVLRKKLKASSSNVYCGKSHMDC